MNTQYGPSSPTHPLNPLRISHLPTADNWDDWYWVAKTFMADPEDWEASTNKNNDLASIVPTAKMWEIVRFFEYHGFSFEPESEESWFRYDEMKEGRSTYPVKELEEWASRAAELLNV
jgi:hypothetical protein